MTRWLAEMGPYRFVVQADDLAGAERAVDAWCDASDPPVERREADIRQLDDEGQVTR